jgi:HD-GYP domain-containing protein (c-di-GMP phosphodiesterase class II)
MSRELQGIYHGLVVDLRDANRKLGVAYDKLRESNQELSRTYDDLRVSNQQLGAAYDGLNEANKQLGIAYDSALQGWSSALELRDHDTQQHTERVTEDVVSLACRMGVPEEELINYRRGALLHDVGKMAIPDSILRKAGQLSEDEWKTMRLHPMYAFVMLRKIPFLHKALDIPYRHHEKWDGSGYPHGLFRQQIPLAARIFSVVDSWDALNHDRPYRKAWPREKAIEYIASQAGKEFDPEVVKAFLEWMNHKKIHALGWMEMEKV